MSFLPATTVHFKVYAIISNYRIPLTYVRIDYPINQIPVCELKAAVGIDTFNGLVSVIHEIKQELFQIPISVYFEVLGVSNSPGYGQLPLGPFCIFEGYVAGFQYERDISTFQVTISAVHWLYDLAFSSSLTDLLHPTAPKDITFNAFLNSPGGSLGNLVGVDVFASFIPPSAFVNDFGTALKAILSFIASTDRFMMQYFPGQYRYNDSSTRLAAQAISRIITNAPPLVIDKKLLDNRLAIAAIIFSILTNTLIEYSPLHLQTLAETTLWERITKALIPMFLIALVPYPRAARLIPYMPTYGGNCWKEIPPDQLWTVSIHGELNKALMAMGVITTTKIPDHSEISNSPGYQNYSAIGSIFVGNTIGMTVFRNAPPYCNFLGFLPPITALQSLALLVHQLRGNNYAFPGFKTPFDIGELSVISMNQRLLLNRLAWYYYTLEITKNRRLYLTGPVRFDIAPGSIVDIVSLNEWFVQRANMRKFGPIIVDNPYQFINLLNNSDINSRIRGYVSNVTFIFRSTPGEALATTAFELTFLRVGEQIFRASFNTPGHPLFSTYYYGSTIY
jgi:hypothetical protein